MAHRKYYSGVLAPHTQKAISGRLAQSWKADLFAAIFRWYMEHVVAINFPGQLDANN